MQAEEGAGGNVEAEPGDQDYVAGALLRDGADRRARLRHRPARDGARREGLDPRRDPLPGAASASVKADGFVRSVANSDPDPSRRHPRSGEYDGALGEGKSFEPPIQAEERSLSVRKVHRAGSPGRGSRAGRGAGAEAQLHRHGAHPARPAARGRRPRRAGARVARHHRRGSARAGRADRRPGRRGDDRPDPVHAAREEGARARAARSAVARPQLHRHRAHPARARARERRRRRAHPARLRRRRREDPQRDHPHALRPRPPPGRRRRPGHGREGRRARSCSTSSAATSRSSRARASSTRSSAARPRSSGSCRSSRAARRTTRC